MTHGGSNISFLNGVSEAQIRGVDEPANNSYGQLHGREAIRGYLLGGNATFTLVSKSTDKRFTYRVKSAAKDRSLNWSTNNQNRDFYFVSVLTGGDNESSYEYLGELIRIEPSGHAFKFRYGRKSKIREDAPSAKGFCWFFAQIEGFKDFDTKVEFWHEGKCCRCGRKLTVPESIASGIGPECAGKE